MAKSGVQGTKSAIIVALIMLLVVIIYAATQLFKSNSVEPLANQPEPVQAEIIESAPVLETETLPEVNETELVQTEAQTPEQGSDLTSTDFVEQQSFETLEQIDDFLNQQLDQYVATSQLKLIWQDDYLRRAVVYIDNLAQGKVVNNHNVFKPLTQPFQVTEQAGKLVQDPLSYKRYDAVVTLFEQLPNAWIISTYSQLSPNIEEIYQEIAPPNTRFKTRINQLIDALLTLPDVPTTAELTSDSVVYTYKQAEYEKLTPAQKQLLRLGPTNIKRLQQKFAQLQSDLNTL